MATQQLQPCDCDDWEEGMAQIQAAQTMSVIHHGAEYTAAVFRYCPWCGKQRDKTHTRRLRKPLLDKLVCQHG